MREFAASGRATSDETNDGGVREDGREVSGRRTREKKAYITCYYLDIVDSQFNIDPACHKQMANSTPGFLTMPPRAICDATGSGRAMLVQTLHN